MHYFWDSSSLFAKFSHKLLAQIEAELKTSLPSDAEFILSWQTQMEDNLNFLGNGRLPQV